MIYRCFLILFILPFLSFGQEREEFSNKMEWFQQAKLGIFIHWGIYSVDGISESWSFFNEYISHEDYMKQLNGFNAKNYNPKDAIDFWDNTNKQDWHICELSQLGIQSKKYHPAPYSGQESLLAAFGKYYKSLLNN